MTRRPLSPNSLRSRIDILRRRHREIDTRITSEHQRPLPDITRLKRLKKERLGLKDAISVTRMILSRQRSGDAQTG